MKSCLVLFILCLGVSSVAAIKTRTDVQIESQSRYHYNVFYDYENRKDDFSFLTIPRLDFLADSTQFGAALKAEGKLEKFMNYTIQDNQIYDLGLKCAAFKEKPLSAGLDLSYSQFSDPSPTDTYGRIQRSNASGEGSLKVRFEGSSSVDFKARYKTEQIALEKIKVNDVDYSHFLDSNTIEGVTQYNNNFLPETVWFLRGTFGILTFDKGQLPSSLTDSGVLTSRRNARYAEGELGISGRLTEKSTIDAAVGVLAREFTTDAEVSSSGTAESGDNFYGPVFFISFTEQVTRRDQLLAGYNYMVKNSYFSHYMLDQEIFLGLAKVFGDQVLGLARVSYDYRSHYQPARREDERVVANFVLKYSISPNFKVSGDLKIDLLGSDARTSTTTGYVIPGLSDGPASYKTGSVGLGITASF